MKTLGKVAFQYALYFHIGGSVYYYVEVMHRGWSHWSMYILGGICCLFIALQRKHPYWNQSLWRQILRCDLFVLCGEFITGCMVNLWKGWAVWDYTLQPFNLLGQICLPMAGIFAVLCAGGIGIYKWIGQAVFGE